MESEIQNNAVYQGEIVAGDDNLFRALQQNVGNHKFKDNRDMQIVVTR